MSKNLRQFTKAVYAFDAVVNRVEADAWGNQTPCDEWDARALVEHQCAVLRGVTEVAQSGAMAAPNPPDDMSDPAATWAETRDGVLGALDSAGTLNQQGPFWFNAETVNDMIGIVTWDPLVHSWDLAKATGQDPAMNEALVQASLETLQPMAGMLSKSGRTAEALEVDSASVIDQYLALVGRDPAWTP